jgi:hypothetical protein
LAALQGLLALLTNADFTFVPLLRVLGQFYYIFSATPSVEAMTVYKYVFVRRVYAPNVKRNILVAMLPNTSRRKRTAEPVRQNSIRPDGFELKNPLFAVFKCRGGGMALKYVMMMCA